MFLAFLVIGSTARVGADVIDPAVTFTTSSTLVDTHPFTLGYEFTISSTVTVNALGYWDDGLAHDHQVGIWDSGGHLLTSTTVLGTDSLVSSFRWHTISSLVLTAGTYTIGGDYLGNSDPFPSKATGIVTIPGYAWVTDEQVLGSGLNFPTQSSGGTLYGQNGILVADFSVASAPTAAPEPSTLAVSSLSAVAYLAFARRRAVVSRGRRR
jgi:hypothetical protein